MVLKCPKEYFVSKELAENPDNLEIETKISYNILHDKYHFTGRMSDFPLFLKDIFGIKEFEFFDERTWNTGEFLSYLIDLQISYRDGESIDMIQLYNDILKVYDFNSKEKRMFVEEHIERRLWGIFIYLNDRNKEVYKLY